MTGTKNVIASYLYAKFRNDHLRVPWTDCSKDMKGTNNEKLFPTFLLAWLHFALLYDAVSRLSETNQHQQTNTRKTILVTDQLNAQILVL